MLRGSIAERSLYALVDEVVTGLRGVDAVGADERRENAAFQKFRPQIDEPAAERAAELRDHIVVVFLPAVQMVGVAQPAEDVLGAETLVMKEKYRLCSSGGREVMATRAPACRALRMAVQ